MESGNKGQGTSPGVGHRCAWRRYGGVCGWGTAERAGSGVIVVGVFRAGVVAHGSARVHSSSAAAEARGASGRTGGNVRAGWRGGQDAGKSEVGEIGGWNQGLAACWASARSGGRRPRVSRSRRVRSWSARVRAAQSLAWAGSLILWKLRKSLRAFSRL